MPKEFNQCVKRGGRVRRKSFDGKYINICFKDGKSYAGETHKKKTKKGRK